MLELADNKISKTHDHDTANRIIDSYRAGLRNAEFQNIAEKNELASVLQTYKAARDQGDILNLENLLSEILGVFGHEPEEAEPTLQAAMLATTTRVEYQDQRGPSGAGGASRGPSGAGGASRSVQVYNKRRFEDEPITSQDTNVLDKILKSLNDLKSEVGFIKKHIAPDQPRQNETQTTKKFVKKGTDSTRRDANFAGVARESTTFVPRPLVSRTLTTIEDNDSEQSAFMTMTVARQPTAQNNFRIMTSQYNNSVLGGYCIRTAMQESHGAGYDLPTINSIRIPDTIPKVYSPQSTETMDQLSNHLRIQVAEPSMADTIMQNLMNEQQDMDVVHDDNSSLPNSSDIYEQAIPYDYVNVQDQQSPPPKAMCIPAQPSLFSSSAPQVEPFEPEIEIAEYDSVVRPILCTGASATNMEVTKPGPVTRSSSRARSIVIPEPRTPSDSEDETHLVARQIRLVPYGASKSPAASIQFQQEQMSQDVPTMIENTSFPTSPNKSVLPQQVEAEYGCQLLKTDTRQTFLYGGIGHVRSSPVLPPSGIQARHKMDTAANRITESPAYDNKHIHDDVPSLVHSSSDEGDM
jgi:hypothetical protein